MAATMVTYCVIPFVRGRSRSLPADQAVSQIRALADAGVNEIVLSGINLGSYGRDLTPRVDLAGLVRRILDETPIQMLRFSSIEPQDITEDFVHLMASSARLAPHFHVPLQSGSDRVLKAMHRWYRTAHYSERVRVIRRVLPDAAIGADVIVGFPGETDEDFRATIELIGRPPVYLFTRLLVFSHVPEPRHDSRQCGAPESNSRAGPRSQGLRAAQSAEFRASQSGRVLRALTLARGCDAWTEAITGNYLRVRSPRAARREPVVEVRLGSEGSVEEIQN